MDKLYSLLICFREDLFEEGIKKPFYVELRNQNRNDDKKEGIVKWASSKGKAIKFAKKYIKKHPNVQYYDFGEA